MKSKVLNYRVIVEKEISNDGVVYVAYVPSLGVSDFGKTIDEAMKNVEGAIDIYLQTLVCTRPTFLV